LTVAALASAAGSALLYGLTSALQHRAANRMPRRSALHPALLGRLLTDPVWLLGAACEAGAILFQALALRAAPVSLVQPVLVLGLPCAVLFSHLLARESPSWRDVGTCVVCALSVAALVVLTEPRGGTSTASTAQWFPAVAVTTAAAVVILFIPAGRHRSTRTAISAGINLGVASILLRLLLTGYGHEPTARLLLPGGTLLAVAALSLLASQSAFQHGTLAAPLAALTVTEPVIAATGGVLILHEELQIGDHLLATVLTAVAALTSVVLLAHTRRPGSSASATGTAH
jgi:drug/metabolite transporter (DMT)-like permease